LPKSNTTFPRERRRPAPAEQPPSHYRRQLAKLLEQGLHFRTPSLPDGPKVLDAFTAAAAKFVEEFKGAEGQPISNARTDPRLRLARAFLIEALAAAKEFAQPTRKPLRLIIPNDMVVDRLFHEFADMARTSAQHAFEGLNPPQQLRVIDLLGSVASDMKLAGAMDLPLFNRSFLM